MTQKEREILFKDLSGRLPYGVIVDYKENEYDSRNWKISTLHAPAYSQSGSLIITDYDGWIEYEEYHGCGMSTGSRTFKIEQHKPYLRPLSSMTEKEKKKFLDADMDDLKICSEAMLKKLQINSNEETIYGMYHHIDWLDKYMFDYRGLIPMGLALEAPKGMYQMEE